MATSDGPALGLGWEREGQGLDSFSPPAALRGAASSYARLARLRATARYWCQMLEQVAPRAAVMAGQRASVAERSRYAAEVFCLAAVYYGAAKLGLSLAFATPSVTAIWPPTGIALTALVLWGYRLWPGVALGALLANSWTGVPIYSVLGIAIGNTLEALVGAYLLLRFAGFRPSLERVRDVIALAVLGGAVSTAISATVGVSSLIAGGEISGADLGSAWRTWWLGDMGGDLVVASALMVAVTQWPFRRAPGRPLEALGLAGLILALAGLTFSQSENVAYILFPALVWAALRFWQPGAVAASLLLASIAIPLTEHDIGPFSGNSPDERLLLAQTFIGVACITALILAAVTTERKRIEDTNLYIAETLQKGLLPAHLPEIPGIEIAVQFRPAEPRQLVGGDFYDWFESSPGTWDVLVGDVAGKEPRRLAPRRSPGTRCGLTQSRSDGRAAS
jgi:integral membrane sensor domain MASE1